MAILTVAKSSTLVGTLHPNLKKKSEDQKLRSYKIFASNMHDFNFSRVIKTIGIGILGVLSLLAFNLAIQTIVSCQITQIICA